MELSLSEVTEILKLLGATVVPCVAFAVRYIFKMRKDINVAHARIRKLQDDLDELRAPECPAKNCPME